MDRIPFDLFRPTKKPAPPDPDMGPVPALVIDINIDAPFNRRKTSVFKFNHNLDE
jgi:hypothetical protein